VATLTVPDEVFRRLEARAAELGTTADALALPAIEQAAAPDAWRQQFDALVAQARARSDRYPPGFQADVSREAMYRGEGG